MKRFLIILLILSLPFMVFGQFKKQTELPAFSEIVAKSSNTFLGFLNPEKFSMHHNISMNFMSFGGAGSMMINSYMNTINYRISDPLLLRLDLGIMSTPYNSFNNPALNNTQFFGGAELYYKPSENSLIKVGFDVRPGYYRPVYRYYNGYDW
jgi:hypothetical protein